MSAPRLLVSTLAGVAVLAAPLVGALGLRWQAHDIHASLVRMGEPTTPVQLLMGPRPSQTELSIQEMETMDQYWFAYQGVDPEQLQQIAREMAGGETALGAMSLACMSTQAQIGLQDAQPEEVEVCVAHGAPTDSDEARSCAPADWQVQTDGLVLLSVIGQHARIDRRQLIASCRANARHWYEWNQRR